MLSFFPLLLIRNLGLIINLKQNPNYFGPDKIFGPFKNLPLAKKLESFNDNYRSIFPASIKTETAIPDELPDSIKEAIIQILQEYGTSYCISFG